MTKILTRDQLWSWDGFKTVEVELPRMGASIIVRELNQAEREAMAVGVAGADGSADITKIEGLQARVVCWAALDENNKPLFKPSQVDKLNRAWPPEALQAAARAVIELSDLNEEEEEEKGEEEPLPN